MPPHPKAKNQHPPIRKFSDVMVALVQALTEL
jgi:hypothetical protein